ncbi:hypothetical protein CA265_13195 [Sphingobacteriaceae bacterium GW460-11-11-14-LB5]|nr:hypothetical protein CA265_13195 [Sphingobacteriaceae bacterium GW460-11-11-14-LB5]
MRLKNKKKNKIAAILPSFCKLIYIVFISIYAISFIGLAEALKTNVCLIEMLNLIFITNFLHESWLHFSYYKKSIHNILATLLHKNIF